LPATSSMKHYVKPEIKWWTSPDRKGEFHALIKYITWRFGAGNWQWAPRNIKDNKYLRV